METVRCFMNRNHQKKKLLIVLAGYKQTLWDKVFSRLDKYIDSDIDVCVVSSGIYLETLNDLCHKYNYSYLATTVNNLCLAQNTCIELFPSAEYIFKMDEDMFVTNGVFKRLYESMIKSIEQYIEPSAIVPIINVNCITYRYILERKYKTDKFMQLLNIKPYITNGLHHHKDILQSFEVAKFMWSEFNIDKLAEEFDDDYRNDTYRRYVVSPGRFSIGLILFRRSVWKDMGKFPVDLDNAVEYKRIGLGEDEKALCVYAMKTCRPIIIDTATCVGHLAYGPQTKEMIEFFNEHQELF